MKPRNARPPRKLPPSRRRKTLPRELNVGEAKARFSQLVDEAARGTHFVIAKAGTPVARIVPLDVRPRRSIIGAWKGLFSPEDERALLKAVEEPLPDEVLAAFYGSPLEAPDK
jgi:prevent-host-death family protein